MEVNEKLRESVDYMLCNPALPRSHKSAGRSPSSASIQFINEYGVLETHGACHREKYYKEKGMPTDDVPESPGSQRMFDYGDAIHEIEVQYRKNAGIYVADEIAFWNPHERISGRIDIANRDPETMEIYGEEIKTTNPYKIDKLMLQPAIPHILQCMLYLDWYSIRNSLMSKWVLTYVDRAFGGNGNFLLTLSNGYCVVNGELDERLELKKVYDRYNILEQHLASNEVPAPDYMIVYDNETLISLKDQGKLTKTVAAKVDKGHKVTMGDKNCDWCKYKNMCSSQRDKGGLNAS